jgi:hypothetical protein
MAVALVLQDQRPRSPCARRVVDPGRRSHYNLACLLAVTGDVGGATRGFERTSRTATFDWGAPIPTSLLCASEAGRRLLEPSPPRGPACPARAELASPPAHGLNCNPAFLRAWCSLDSRPFVTEPSLLDPFVSWRVQNAKRANPWRAVASRRALGSVHSGDRAGMNPHVHGGPEDSTNKPGGRHGQMDGARLMMLLPLERRERTTTITTRTTVMRSSTTRTGVHRPCGRPVPADDRLSALRWFLQNYQVTLMSGVTFPMPRSWVITDGQSIGVSRAPRRQHRQRAVRRGVHHRGDERQCRSECLLYCSGRSERASRWRSSVLGPIR